MDVLNTILRPSAELNVIHYVHIKRMKIFAKFENAFAVAPANQDHKTDSSLRENAFASCYLVISSNNTRYHSHGLGSRRPFTRQRRGFMSIWLSLKNCWTISIHVLAVAQKYYFHGFHNSGYESRKNSLTIINPFEKIARSLRI